jgi:uncharacterized protein (DUF58 family)
MDFPATGVSKFRYGQIVAASLAHLVSTQGDAVGLVVAVGDRITYLPARGGRHHLRSVITQIDRLTPASSWQSDRIVARATDLLKRRGALLVISDFYDDEERTRRELRRSARRGHDVSMLQIMSPEERTLESRDDLEFEDLESGERRLVNAPAVAARYRAAVDEFLSRSETEARRDGIDYALLSTDQPIGRSLRGYLLRRAETTSRTVGR